MKAHCPHFSLPYDICQGVGEIQSLSQAEGRELVPLPCWGSYEILLRLVHTAARRSGGSKVAFVIGASKQHLHSSPNPSAVFDPAKAVCSVGHQRGVGDEVDRVITYTYTSVSFFPQFFSARFDRWKKKVRTVAGKACTLPCFLHCHSLLHARRDKFLARTPFWRRRSWGVVLASCFCIGWHDHVRGLILRTLDISQAWRRQRHSKWTNGRPVAAVSASQTFREGHIRATDQWFRASRWLRPSPGKTDTIGVESW